MRRQAEGSQQQRHANQEVHAGQHEPRGIFTTLIPPAVLLAPGKHRGGTTPSAGPPGGGKSIITSFISLCSSSLSTCSNCAVIAR